MVEYEAALLAALLDLDREQLGVPPVARRWTRRGGAPRRALSIATCSAQPTRSRSSGSEPRGVPSPPRRGAPARRGPHRGGRRTARARARLLPRRPRDAVHRRGRGAPRRRRTARFGARAPDARLRPGGAATDGTHPLVLSRSCNELVSGELDLFVAPLRRPVMAGDQAGAVQATEVAVDECIARLGRRLSGALGEAEMPLRVLTPGVRLEERVLVRGFRAGPRPSRWSARTGVL